MFICFISFIYILYFSMYPKKWANKARVYGVNNRAEFKTGQAEEFINTLSDTHHKQATVMLIVMSIISVLLLFVPGLTIKMVAWTVFIYLGILIFPIPYMLGNSEMKKYKKALGIISEKTLYADLKNAGSVHALNIPMLAISNIFGASVFLAALLIDLGVLPINLGIYNHAFILTALVGSVIFTNIIFIPIAFIADNARNIVISENSDINANYNRSKKKIFSDLTMAITWIDNIIALITIVLFILFSSELLTLFVFGAYLLVIMFFMGLLVYKNRILEHKYLGENSNLLKDDDDNWILGMFYFNPSDKRLNVEKRVGVGITVNMAHPVGIVISVIGILGIVSSILAIVWIVLMGQTPIRIINNNDTLICHHLRDEYTINKADIVSVECGNLSDIKMVKAAGTAMETVAKGKFSVDGNPGTLFLNPEAGKYIKIVTNDKTYYISDYTEEETNALFESLSK